MAIRGPGRILAPLALIAALLGVLVVVLVSRADAPPSVESTKHVATKTHPARAQRRSYIVKPGDNLTVIADKTGVTIDTIERLNPDVDPQALAAGARLKLAP